MDLTNFWFSSGAGGGPVPPVPIPGTANSLRFRGGQRLTRAVPANGDRANFTISVWAKHVVDQNIFFQQQTITTGYASSFGIRNTNRAQAGNISNFVGPQPASTALFRDSSAWYHCLLNYGTNGLTIFINGVQVANATNTSGAVINSAGTYIIGGTGSSASFGYMADYYFIDGQTLEPTAFGNFNDDGVWVPREVDFTPAQMRPSDFLTATIGTIDNGPLGATAAFNGDLSDGDGRCFTSAGGQLTWAPATDYTFDSTLEIYNTNTAAQQDITWNGNTVNPTGGWVTVFSGAGTINAATPLVITGNGGGNRAELYAVRLDGEIVLDPFIWSGQLFATDSQAAPPFDTTDKAFNASGPATPASNAFNGNNGDYAGSTNPGSWIVFRPNTPINVNNQIRFQCNFGLSEVWINEVQQTITLNQELFEFDFDGDLENLAIRGNPTSFAATLIYLELDGQTLIDGVNNSYGANGFHLMFEDPDDLGHDSSGNENNFTATGFDTDPVGIFSDNLFTGANGSTAFDWNTTATNFAAGSPATFGFNNQGNNVGSNANNSLVFRPATELTGITEIAVEVDATATWQLGLNGADVASLDAMGTAGFKRATLPAGFNGTVTSFGLRNTNAAGGSAFSRIRINGTTVLVDNTGADYDPMEDGPSQNYATLNPLATQSGITLSAANMQASTGNYLTAPGTIAMPPNTGRYYFEINFLTQGTNAIAGLVGPSGSPSANIDPLAIWCPKLNAIESNGLGTLSNIVDTGATPVSTANGEVYMYAYDSDTQRLWVGQQGTWYRRNGDTADGDPAAGTNPLASSADAAFATDATWTAGTAGSSVVGTDSYSVNVGQQPFIYTPPTGFEHLQTQNLPAAPIADGSDNFRALTGTGANILAIAQGTNTTGDNWNADVNTGFTNGLWWIKDMDNTNNWQLACSEYDVAPTNNVVITNASDYIAYNTPAGNSIAYCWDLSNPATNGCEFISTTGNQTVGTVNHNLGRVPQMVWAFNIGVPASNNVWVYHSGLGAGGALNLANNNAPDNRNIFWGGNNAAFTTTTFGVGNAASTNPSGPVYYWLWSEIPGYSAFGTYTGGGSGSAPNYNGPFIYLGFRPSWLLIKRSNADGDPWILLDSTRDTHNFAFQALQPNSPNQEVSSGDQFAIDFLSNGFKCRSANAAINNSAGTYVYCAFAENPFGGSNVSPANAR